MGKDNPNSDRPSGICPLPLDLRCDRLLRSEFLLSGNDDVAKIDFRGVIVIVSRLESCMKLMKVDILVEKNVLPDRLGKRVNEADVTEMKDPSLKKRFIGGKA